ncbi:hypothetical protein Tco_0944547, partial [Tanacetum coccineum]
MVNTRTDVELADAMLLQIRQQVREEYRTDAVASGSNPPPVTIHTWLERFNKQKPCSFEKAVAPVDAENWISHMEKIFDVMDCNDAFKTRLVVYKFEGDALAWWKAYKQAKGGIRVETDISRTLSRIIIGVTIRKMTVKGLTGRAVLVTTVTTITTTTLVTTTGILVLDATKGTEVSNPTDLPTL